ncbi:MAG TPA: PadR family transcriptional regulator [Candidatus Saccharimonadales bacterium]|nr:PadR family transcriptional regulator [Candidatus Saccharimonadales bacterium]
MSRKTPNLLPQVSFSILFALSLKPRHGYELMKQVEADSGRRLKIGPGALYGAIKQLLEEGLIEELPHKIGDPRRRYYKLTKKGWNRLRADIEYFKSTVDLARGRKMPNEAAGMAMWVS